MTSKSRVCLFAFVLVGTLGLVFVTTTSALAAAPAETISYWKLDEAAQVPPGVYVEEINANDGACAAGGCPDAVAGQVDGAQDFDASDGIDVPAPAPGEDFNWAGDASFSIALWMNRDDTGGANLPDNEVIIGRDDTTPPVGTVHWWVGLDSATPGPGGEGAVATFVLSDSGVQAPNSGFGVIGTSDLADGAWHHIVAVRDDAAGKLRLYVDGAQEAEKDVATGAYATGFDSTENLTMGYMLFGVATDFFEGAIDEVSLYGKALSAAEVTEQYQAGLAGEGIDTLVDDTDDTVTKKKKSGGGSGGCFISAMAE
ncbi:MAG: LamG domain-containing protein [Desulfatiglandaceae bacterium]